MSSLPPVPAGLNLNDSQQSSIKISILMTWALAVVVVGLRFLSRYISKAKLWIDDWLIIPPLIFATILCFISTIWMPNYGLGKHVWVAPARAEIVFFQGLFISELVYTGVMTCVKFSVLALYFRLFKLYHVKLAVYTVAAVVTSWGVGVLLTTCLQCIPLRGFWDKSIPATCGVNDYKFFIGNSVPNICTDIAILCIPMRPVWKLNMSRNQKVVLTLMFLMGGFVTATSITRLVYLMKLDLSSADFTWNFGITQIWTCVEIHAAIISACLPCLRPIFSRLIPDFARERSTRLLESSSPFSMKRSNVSAKKQDESLLGTDAFYHQFGKLQDTEIQAESSAAGVTKPGTIYEMHGFHEPHQIMVQNDINVRWHEVKQN